MSDHEGDDTLPLCEPGAGTAQASSSSTDAKRQASLLKRSYAIAELLDTERSYIDKLRGAVQNYLHPIMEGAVEGVVKGKDISEVAPIIFGNIEEILHFHEE